MIHKQIKISAYKERSYLKYVSIYLAIFVFNVVGFSLVYKQFPNYRNYLFLEDGLVENLTVLFYLVSFFLGVRFLIKLKTYKTIFILIPTLGLICFLDELSFGERIFELAMPYIGGVKIDGVHDFFTLTFEIAKRFGFLHSTFTHLIVGIVVGIVIVSFIYWSKIVNAMARISRQPYYMFLLIFVVLGFLSLLIDLPLINYKPGFMSLLEEVFEMNAAIALCFLCLSLPKAKNLSEKYT